MTERVEFGTGLAVSRVDIGVVDVVAAPAEPAPEAGGDAPAAEAPPEHA